MLVIRGDQLRRLERAQLEQQVLFHLREFFPDDCDSLGEDAVREMIRYGFGRAEGHGFTDGGALCRYVDIMVAFGRDFDREQPWAREVLEDESILDPDVRMEELCDAAADSLGDGYEDADESEELTA